MHEVYLIIWNSYFTFLFCFVLLDTSGGFAETPKGFIFSLNNFEGLAPFVSQVKTGNTIYRGSTFGPTFGQDLLIFHNGPFGRQSLTNFGNSYYFPALVTDKLQKPGWHNENFLPDEVEVFYLDPSR